MLDDRPSGTALVTALARAVERRLPEGERVLDDPFAPSVIEAAGLGLLDQQSPGVNALEVVVRRLHGDALRARVPVVVQ